MNDFDAILEPVTRRVTVELTEADLKLVIDVLSAARSLGRLVGRESLGVGRLMRTLDDAAAQAERQRTQTQ